MCKQLLLPRQNVAEPLHRQFRLLDCGPSLRQFFLRRPRYYTRQIGLGSFQLCLALCERERQLRCVEPHDGSAGLHFIAHIAGDPLHRAGHLRDERDVSLRQHIACEARNASCGRFRRVPATRTEGISPTVGDCAAVVAAGDPTG